MIVKLKEQELENTKFILSILEHCYENKREVSCHKINYEGLEKLQSECEEPTQTILYQDENSDSNFYVIDIKNLKKDFDFFMFLHKYGWDKLEYVLIAENLVQKNDEKLVCVNRNYNYGRLEYEEQRYNEVFSRYAKTIDTVIVNQNKEAKNIINIQDCMSIRNMFLMNSRSNNHEFTSEMSGYYINPNMAIMFNGKKVELNMLFELFAINENTLFEKIQKLKEKKLDICLIGLGGTMSNFVYFLNEMMNYFKMDDLFENLAIYENDYLEISNLPRIPLDYLTPIKLKNNYDLIPKISIFRNMRRLFKNNYCEERMFNINKAQCFDFVIGSPNIQTRVEMFEHNQKQNFIVPLHYNNELVIFENPKVIDSSISSETYGSIELTYFFLNMFRMTIELIDIMLKDRLGKNKKVLHYNSKESIDEFRNNVKKSVNTYVFS